MTGVIDAAGTIGEGALWARAVEPTAGAAQGHGEGACLNCGMALAGRYCHACGQSSHVHKTLASIGHDLLHGVFHFEGKIWRTLPMLVLHPGQLTRRYIDGERAKFVSPLALFLFTVFLMFAIWSALGSDLAKNVEKSWSSAAPQLAEKRAEGAAELATLEKERSALVTAGKPVAKIDGRIAERRGDLAALSRVIDANETRADNNVRVRSDWDWLDHALAKAKSNPGLVVYKVQSAAYKFSWALIVLSTPMVALLFLWRRRFGLYDHATFVTYSISFISLLVIMAQVLSAAGVLGGVVVALLLLAPPVHMFVQLRGTYGLGWFSALWRTVALLFFSSWALALFTLGVVALEVTH